MTGGCHQGFFSPFVLLIDQSKWYTYMYAGRNDLQSSSFSFVKRREYSPRSSSGLGTNDASAIPPPAARLLDPQQTITPNFYVQSATLDFSPAHFRSPNGPLPLAKRYHNYQVTPPGSLDLPRRVEGLLNGQPVRYIAAGRDNALALSVSGAAFAWGSNKKGKLGVTSETRDRFFAPERVDLPGPARMLACGGTHSAFVLKSGRVFLCGDNEMGQLGQDLEEVQMSLCGGNRHVMCGNAQLVWKNALREQNVATSYGGGGDVNELWNKRRTMQRRAMRSHVLR